MKKMNKLLTLMASLLAILIVGISCDSINDIQSEFAGMEERAYLGKVDSLKVQPGFGRAKITWYIGTDPKIEQTVIYWNMRRDSIVKDFVRATPGIQKDSIIIENLTESSILYEFRNKNSKGESSLYSSITVTAWGENFASNLFERKLTMREYDFALSHYKLGLSPAITGDSVVYSQINYKDKDGVNKTVKIERNTDIIELANFPDGAEFQFRNVFFLPQGLDTVYGNYQTFKAPTAKFENGKKLSLKGNISSRYFERDGDKLYEWNADGDVIVYALNEDGSFSQTETYLSLVPRSNYREFFFYDDDKFIGVSTGNLVSMHRIVDGQLVTVKTPSGAETFGSSFNMIKFIPAKGFFYSIAPTTGDLRTWFANNNATWGSSNGTTVTKGFFYDPVILYNYQYLVCVDQDGYLWSIPITTSGTFGSKNKIGTGWSKFVKIINVGNKILGLDANGDFYEFDFNATDNYWILD
ncbi:MAG: DUF4998 domain-containing protein [Proteiniphilum sp.]|nr:DUF4998 domain-containing protein [Proteiniphilum sp.]MDD3909795.1 DUF4998 domain-containing protein [Proteiniphilum sp.]MDD4416747.1 DUF4998 domain-containing protein [Proteiniphilum sp.]